MKVTLQRNVHNNVDLLLDKSFDSDQAAKDFFKKVNDNLTAKSFAQVAVFTENGRQFKKFVLRGKHYILGLY